MLFNPRLSKSYEIRNDIPVMLIDEAVTVGNDERDRLLAVVSEESIELTF